jgi:hypothetical protein
MKCKNEKCQSTNIIGVNGRCSDRCVIETPAGTIGPDYVPYNLGIGGGDDISFKLCMNCGMIQDKWPKSLPSDNGEPNPWHE